MVCYTCSWRTADRAAAALTIHQVPARHGVHRPLHRVWRHPRLMRYFFACLLMGLSIVNSWGMAIDSEEHTFYPAPFPRLIACIAPQTTAALAPCPTPDPGGPSTTELGACPANSPSQWVACFNLSTLANTYAFDLVLLWGMLCALWWVVSLVRAVSPLGQVHPAQALGLALRNGGIAAFAFLVAWSLQAFYAQVEALLLASVSGPDGLPLSTVVFLASVLLGLLIRIGLGLWLLGMLFELLKGAFASASNSPRTLAMVMERFRFMGVVLLLLLLAPWLIQLAAQAMTGRSF